MNRIVRKRVFRFPTRFETNQAVLQQKMASSLKFQVEGPSYVVKTKVLISCAVTEQLICAFVFAYVRSRFSHVAKYNILPWRESSLIFSLHLCFVYVGDQLLTENNEIVVQQSIWSLTIVNFRICQTDPIYTNRCIDHIHVPG